MCAVADSVVTGIPELVQHLKEPQERNIYELALAKYGKPKQLGKLVEECGELIAAVQQYLQRRVNADVVIGEVIDVELLCKQARLIVGNPSLWRDIWNQKVLRLHRNLSEKKKPGKP